VAAAASPLPLPSSVHEHLVGCCALRLCGACQEEDLADLLGTSSGSGSDSGISGRTGPSVGVVLLLVLVPLPAGACSSALPPRLLLPSARTWYLRVVCTAGEGGFTLGASWAHVNRYG
jgi:hypothetical protein